MALNLGGIPRLTYSVAVNNVPTNPSSATLTITQPDGVVLTITSPTLDITPTDVGELVYDFAPTQTGLHSVHWVTTGPSSADDDVFHVAAPGRMLVGVDAAINHLRATQTITGDADRETVQDLCLVATDAVERDLDRVLVRRTFTETHSGSSSALMLRKTPVLSVTSVTESGTLLTAGDYLLDPALGFLYRGTTTAVQSWTAGAYNVAVVYVAGYADPPRAARMVALNLIQSMWQQSQQAFHPALDESAEFALPTAVAGLPDPLRRAYDSLRSAAGVA